MDKLQLEVILSAIDRATRPLRSITKESGALAKGLRKSRDDLAALNEPLRSHGGLTEQEVPFIANRTLPELLSADALRNFDAFYYALVAAAQPAH